MELGSDDTTPTPPDADRADPAQPQQHAFVQNHSVGAVDAASPVPSCASPTKDGGVGGASVLAGAAPGPASSAAGTDVAGGGGGGGGEGGGEGGGGAVGVGA